MEYIQTPKVLEQWAGLTLHQRTAKLYQQFNGLKISASWLSKLYKKLKITMKSVQIVKFSNLKTVKKIKLQTEAAKVQIQRWLEEKVDIMYLDECCFTVQTYRKREFSARHQYLSVNAPQFQMKTIAFLGVVSQDRGIYYYELFDRSVNTEKFVGFLKRLRAKYGAGRLALYQDNLRVHKSILATQAYADLKIEV